MGKFVETVQFQVIGGFAKLTRDLTERKLAEDRIQHAATHDELTGLPNRALLLDRLGMAIERAKRSSDRTSSSSEASPAHDCSRNWTRRLAVCSRASV